MRGDQELNMGIDPQPLQCKHGHDHATPEGAKTCQHAEDAWVRIAAENAADANIRLAVVVAQRDELLTLLRRIVVRDGLNDNQWFWLHDCEELLARIDKSEGR